MKDQEQEFSEIERLKAEVERLAAENKRLAAVIRRAKDPSPVERCSFKRVMQLATDACMTLTRVAKGWILKLGNKERHFRFLKLIWEILVEEEWLLEDLFPPQPSSSHPPKLPQRHRPLLPPALPIFNRVTYKPGGG